MSELLTELNSPHTFAIIFHSEAGRTTLTQKLLLFGDAIQCVDLAMSRKISRDVTSNWMDIEKQGGISITTSVIQFEHKDCILYLFDTPCHEFFRKTLMAPSPPSIWL